MIFKNHTDQTYQLLAEFKRSPAPVDKSLKNKKYFKKRKKLTKPTRKIDGAHFFVRSFSNWFKTSFKIYYFWKN